MTVHTPFSVWAPTPTTVRLSLADDTLPMLRAADGWWTPEPDALHAALERAEGRPVDYGYLLDDDPTMLPDPRSRRQPSGVHERSRSFDPGEFAWSDAAWTGRQLAGGVIYELHIGTFTREGTLDAAAGRLDHLKSIGVDFVELLPVNAFNGTHNWGYDGVLWYAVHEQYGGPAAYQRFVDACHAAGLGVVQDVVYNHLGPSGNYLPRFGPYLHPASANTWGASLNLDGDQSDPVRRYIIDNALAWFRDYHVDALRLDAVHALVDHRATHLLEQVAQDVAVLSAELGRPLTLIAESDLNDPRLITPRDAGGYGLDAQWSDDFHHALHSNLTGEANGYYTDFHSLEALDKVLQRGFFHDGSFSSFRGRNHGRPIDRDRMPTWRLVVCSQNHDQIGNRAAGDRLSAQLDPGQLGIAAVLVMLGPFTPMLFMGEEWAASTPWQFFTSHPEPELGVATAKGRIAEFARMGWDESTVPNPQDPATFDRSKLRWEEREQGEHARLLALYRQLAELRAGHPEFRDPRFRDIRTRFDAAAGWFLLGRGAVSIAVNFSDQPTRVPLEAGHRMLLLAADAVMLDRDAVLLPGHAFAVLATRR
ncbi:malto-oligosyltrehalose trehalohydrolase [Salinibacterium sp. ZJ450]|uniref:malto-oligosyltrehalose trehalohydrolase n=1 Tax=Salinibacterium sp. ZJ450 TaxID=2708338 RepID=UPI00141EB5B8|nr:malto-oligosyltrehalose trehalohydrolase [Salinibacterium sp. ZJ450]